MPLSPGSSRGVISSNIREMVNAGHPQRVAVAAALSNADRHPNDAGLASRGSIGKMHPNDSGLRTRIKTAPVAPVLPNDVGLTRMAGSAGNAGRRNMTRTELHSTRQEMGRKPRG